MLIDDENLTFDKIEDFVGVRGDHESILFYEEGKPSGDWDIDLDVVKIRNDLYHKLEIYKTTRTWGDRFEINSPASCSVSVDYYLYKEMARKFLNPCPDCYIEVRLDVPMEEALVSSES